MSVDKDHTIDKHRFVKHGWTDDGAEDIEMQHQVDFTLLRLDELSLMLEMHGDNRTKEILPDDSSTPLKKSHHSTTQNKNRAITTKESFNINQRHLDILINSVPGIIYHCLNDEHWTMLFINDEVERITGYPASDFIDNKIRSFATLIHPDDRDLVRKTIDESIAHKQPYDLNYRLLAKDGTLIYVHERGDVLFDDEGTVLGLDGVLLDTTDQKNAEDSLRRSEQEYRAIFDNSGASTCIIDEDTTILQVNSMFSSLSGYTKEELEGKMKWTDFVADEDLERMKEYHRRRREKNEHNTPTKYEFMFIDRSGKSHPALLFINMIPDTKKSIASLLDLTTTKKMEKALQTSQRRFKNLSNLTFEGILIHHNGVVIDVNRSLEQMLGYTRKELIGKNLITLVIPEEYHEIIKEHISKEVSKPYEVMARRKDGTLFPLELEARDIAHEEGRQRVAALRDITERKRTQQEAEESKKNTESILDAAADGIILIDRDYTIRALNQTMADMASVDKDKVIGKRCMEMLSCELFNTDECHMGQMLKDPHVIESEEIRWNSSVEKRIYLSRTTPWYDPKGGIRGVIEDLRDITELKKNQMNFKALFESSRDALMTISPPDWNFRSGNQAAITLFGVQDESSFTTVGPFDISPEYQPDGMLSSIKAKEMIQRALDEGSAYFEWTHKTITGREFPSTVLLTRIDIENEEPYLQATVRDVTEEKHVQEQLEKSEKNYREIFNNSINAIFILSLEDMSVIDVNDEVCRRFGYTREEMKELSIDILCEPDHNMHFSKGSQMVKSTSAGEIFTTECLSKRKNGELFWEEIRGKQIILDDRKYLLVIAKDIDESKKAAETLRDTEIKYQTYIDSAPDGIFIADETGRYLEVNDAACKMTGYTKEELLTMSIPDMAPPDHNESYKHLFNSLKNDGHSSEECLYKKKDGSIEWWSVDAVVLSDVRFLGFTKNITERKNFEKDIQQKNIELKRLDELKSNFLNITSHELRTPMTAIKGHIEMLDNGMLGDVTEEQKHSIDVVIRNANRLDELINDILDTSRLESGTMKFEAMPTSIKDLITQTSETMQSQADTKHITIKTTIENDLPDITIDRSRINQVFVNLLSNAIKFSDEHTLIEFNAKDQDDFLLFEIKDHGKGIPKKEQEKIFDLFYQVESGMDRNSGGNGLGLTISRGIILSHGGKIWVESGKDRGSIFKILLPKKLTCDAEGTFKKIDIFNMHNDSLTTGKASPNQTDEETDNHSSYHQSMKKDA